MSRRKNTSAVLVYGVLVFITIICLFPIVWMCLISIKSASESITGFNSLTVSNPTMASFKRLFEMISVGQNAFNSVSTTIMGTITSPFLCVLAGLAFAEHRLLGRESLFYSVIAIMLVSSEVGSVLLSIIMKRVRLINSLWSLVIPRIATAVGISYMNQHIIDVPNELVEAARVNGCSDFGIFARIILPVTKPAMASWGAITLVARWNDLLWPLLYLRKQARHTLMVTILLLPVGEGLSTPWSVILVGITLVIIPIIILYLTLEKFQKAGMMEGTAKG